VSRLVTVVVTAAVLVAIPGVASAAVDITQIQYNSPGRDSGSNTSLNREYVVIENTGNHVIRLTGWTLRDSDHNVYGFAGFRLKAGDKVFIHTGKGDDTRRNLYWGLDKYVWDNNRDTAVLKNRAGDVVDRCSYSGGGRLVEC